MCRYMLCVWICRWLVCQCFSNLLILQIMLTVILCGWMWRLSLNSMLARLRINILMETRGHLLNIYEARPVRPDAAIFSTLWQIHRNIYQHIQQNTNVEHFNNRDYARYLNLDRYSHTNDHNSAGWMASEWI